MYKAMWAFWIVITLSFRQILYYSMFVLNILWWCYLFVCVYSWCLIECWFGFDVSFVSFSWYFYHSQLLMCKHGVIFQCDFDLLCFSVLMVWLGWFTYFFILKRHTIPLWDSKQSWLVLPVISHLEVLKASGTVCLAMWWTLQCQVVFLRADFDRITYWFLSCFFLLL